MNIQYPAGVKREWFDRNGLVVHQYYIGSSVAPHAQSNRFTYSVPSGRLCMVMGATLNLWRRTAATTPDLWGAGLRLEHSGNYYYFCELMGNDNNLWVVKNQIFSCQVICYPNDILRGWTFDQSTGGTVDYELAIFAQEFDQ